MSDRPAPATLAAVLTAAVLAISASAVLVRGLHGVSPWEIAWWRCAGTAVLLLPAARGVTLRELAGLALTGGVLAAHFVTWFESIAHTTILHSTLLVTLTPIWVGLVDRFVRGDDPGPGFWIGTAVAIPGVLLLSGELGGTATRYGDLLATFAGGASAVYVLLGRALRRTVPMGTYGALVPLFAAAILAPLIAAQGIGIGGHDRTAWVLLAACVIGPQLIGHNGLNWALRYVPAPRVSALLLLEPVGATLLAGVVFAEWPTALGVAGSTLVVTGVALAVRARGAETRTAVTDP